MAGAPVADLAETLVRVEVGHLVSSSSMVSRAYLGDQCFGVVVEGGEASYWLVSALSVLAPDPNDLRVRAAEKGGIPVEHGTPRLVKITLRWGEASADLANPTVLHGDGVGSVSLAVPASLGDRIRAGVRPVDASAASSLHLGDEVGIVSLHDGWPFVRWARVASDPGFGATPGALAVDVGVPADHAGAPVFSFGASGPGFCGLIQPLDDSTALLLPPTAILDVIPSP